MRWKVKATSIVLKDCQVQGFWLLALTVDELKNVRSQGRKREWVPFTMRRDAWKWGIWETLQALGPIVVILAEGYLIGLFCLLGHYWLQNFMDRGGCGEFSVSHCLQPAGWFWGCRGRDRAPCCVGREAT